MTSILLTTDYFFWSKVEGTAKALGVATQLAKTLADIQSLLVSDTQIHQILIDLRHPEFLAAIQLCVEKKIPTVGFVSHMDSETITAARAAGCSTVMPKSQFSAQLSQILAR